MPSDYRLTDSLPSGMTSPEAYGATKMAGRPPQMLCSEDLERFVGDVQYTMAEAHNRLNQIADEQAMWMRLVDSCERVMAALAPQTPVLNQSARGLGR